MIKVKFEEQVSGRQKNWKTDVWSLDFGQNIKTSFLQKIHAHAVGGEFLFWLVPKKFAKEKSLSLFESDLKRKSLPELWKI